MGSGYRLLLCRLSDTHLDARRTRRQADKAHAAGAEAEAPAPGPLPMTKFGQPSPTRGTRCFCAGFEWRSQALRPRQASLAMCRVCALVPSYMAPTPTAAAAATLSVRLNRTHLRSRGVGLDRNGTVVAWSIGAQGPRIGNGLELAPCALRPLPCGKRGLCTPSALVAVLWARPDCAVRGACSMRLGCRISRRGGRRRDGLFLVIGYRMAVREAQRGSEREKTPMAGARVKGHWH